MKTAHYTFTTWDDSVMAAGFDGAVGGRHQAALVRQTQRVRAAGEDKVIDLTAWRAANLNLVEEAWEQPAWDGGEPGQDAEPVEELTVPAPRLRRSHRAMVTAELASTLSVVAAALVLILRVLAF